MDALGTYCWIIALEKKDLPSLDGLVAVVALFLFAILLKNLAYVPEPKHIVQQTPSPGPVINLRNFSYITIDTQRGKRQAVAYERIPPILPQGY